MPIPPDAAARLDLSGVYWLTLTDSANPLEQTRWEIVEVSAGLSILRGRDGTAAQSWPAETLIYCAVTAGQMSQMHAQVDSLLLRVAALESGGGGGVVDGALTDGSGNTLTDESNNPLVGA